MQKTFIEKYRYYCKAMDIIDDIFRMIQGETGSQEDYEYIVQLTYKRAYSFKLDGNSLKLVFLKGVRGEFMENLNILTNGYVFQLEYEYIKKVFKKYFMSTRKKSRNGINVSPQSFNSTTIIKNEIGRLLEDMKTNILHSLDM
jgi:hypothetical protein